jgi:hypothetical protein
VRYNNLAIFFTVTQSFFRFIHPFFVILLHATVTHLFPTMPQSFFIFSSAIFIFRRVLQ